MEAGVESGILAVPLQTAMKTEIPLGLAARRGLLGLCPSCGKTKLFASYLKQVQSCANCGAECAGHGITPPQGLGMRV